ncbi:MAG: RES family NAD+ phosphorylase [Acetobacteraceae bacterium]
MSRTVWRIAADTPDYEADDLSGAGAERMRGRWNERGVPVVYASESRALACLETVVHLTAGGFPFNRYLVAVTIPDDIWASAQTESAASVPVGWDAEPAGHASIRFGTEWARSGRAALLVVPSVIVAEEFNILVNPRHADSPRITAAKARKWLYDIRLNKPTTSAPSPAA